MTQDQVNALLLTLVGGLLAGNIWWLRRLIASLDAFKAIVREDLVDHGQQLAVIAERHRLEDQQGTRGRRSYDRGVSS